MSVFLAVVAFAAVLFAWFCLFKVIPDSLMAMFRFRLWRERDAIAMEIFEDRYSDPEVAEEIAREVENFIDLAPQLSPLHIGLMRVSEIGMSEHEEDYWRKLNDLEPVEREALEDHMGKINELVANHVMLETPSGWLTLLLGLPIATAVVLFRKVSQKNYAGSLMGGLRRRFSDGSRELACREHLA
jgi:hypothetical protein